MSKSWAAPGTGWILAQLTALSVPLQGWRLLELVTNLQDPSGYWRNATESQEYPTEGTDPSLLPNGSVLVSRCLLPFAQGKTEK